MPVGHDADGTPRQLSKHTQYVDSCTSRITDSDYTGVETVHGEVEACLDACQLCLVGNLPGVLDAEVIEGTNESVHGGPDIGISVFPYCPTPDR